MEQVNDRYLIPFSLGGELSVESFKLSQSDNTYMLAAPRYKQFYSSYVRPRIAMYRGWVEGYHNIEYGAIPTLFLQKVGAGISGLLLGKPFVLNTNEHATLAVVNKEYEKSNFNAGAKMGFNYSMEGGSGLIKWNRDGRNQLRLESLPMDKFFVEVDAYGDIEAVKCYIATYHDTISSSKEYYLCEERFFKYATIGGETKRFPMVHYLFYESSSSVANEATPAPSAAIKWGDIPYNVRKMIQRDYGDIMIDMHEYGTIKDYERCKLLPFDDDLGVRLLNFTQGIPAFPSLPFGQPLADLLMNESYAYDQLKFFERLEVYISRGRIMLDKQYGNINDPDTTKSALDPLVFSYYNSSAGEADSMKPEGLQLELRAENIHRQKQNILNDTAFALNLSATTVASWLSDGQTQKTTIEIEYERTKTTSFINDKLNLIQQPLQEMLDIFFHYYGVPSVELNLMPENQTVRSEMIRLYSELYDKGQIDAKMLAKEILGTCSTQEIDKLAKYIEEQHQPQIQMPVQGFKEN